MTVKNLVPGTAYKFLIRAHTDGGWSKVYGKDVIEVTTSSASGGTDAKTSGGSLSVTSQLSSGKVRFSWDKVAGADKYGIYIYRDGRYQTLSEDIAGTAVTITKLVPGTTYKFIIRAHKNGAWTKVYNKDVIEITAK